MEHEKRELEYERPVVEDYGDLAELTAAELTGITFDIPLPLGTLFHHTPSP